MLAPILIIAVFGIIMLCIEVVLPGAIIGIIGGGLVTAALVLVFISPSMQAYGLGIQFAVAFGIIVATVITLVTWMRRFHETAIGRRLILNTTSGGDSQPLATASLAGREGVAKSDMRPSGTVLIDGKRHEAQSVTGFVPRGTTVRVSKSTGNILIVTPVPDCGPENPATDTTETSDAARR